VKTEIYKPEKKPTAEHKEIVRAWLIHLDMSQIWFTLIITTGRLIFKSTGAGIWGKLSSVPAVLTFKDSHRGQQC